MKLLFRLVSVISLWRAALGGQIPKTDGVMAGVRASPEVQPHVLTSVARTPGKLRIVENSGICGWLLFYTILRVSV